MECDGDSLSDIQNYVIWGGTMVSSVLSLFGSTFMLASFLKFGKAKRLSVMVSLLALGDYMWSVSALITGVILFRDESMFTYPICVTMRVIFQIFAGSTIFWCTAISIRIWREVTKMEEAVPLNVEYELFNRKKKSKTPERIKSWTFYCLAAYLIPVGGTIINLVGHQIYQDDWSGICFPEDPWHWILWFVPNALGIFAVLICYIAIQRSFRRRNIRASFWDYLKSFRNLTMPAHYRISLYLFVMLICWPLDGLHYILGSVFQISYCKLFPLTLVYCVFLQMQGAFNALVFAVTNRQFRDYYSRTSSWSFFFFVLFSPITMYWILIKRILRSFRTASHSEDDGHLTDDQEITVASSIPRIHLVA